MPVYEYKVVPAPKKGPRVKGVRSTEERFAIALQGVMNSLGTDGWEYQRTDTLPCEERSGLTGKSTSFQNMLVFRREVEPIAKPIQIEAPKAPVVEDADERPEAPTMEIRTPTIESAVAGARSDFVTLGGVTKSDPNIRKSSAETQDN